MISKVRAFIRQHNLIPRGARVLAAVSGGSDSTALAHILHELAGSGDFELRGLLHFNHRLRGAATRDELFVRELAASLAVPLIVDSEDVVARAQRDRQSIETAARTARHAFFERARASAEADAIALGHTRDDQAETVLLRLVRGAGPRGLSGMHPRNGHLVRPLLASGRGELRGFLAERGLRFVEDETNADASIPRNRVRLELLPVLADRFNPSIIDVLADQAELTRDLWTWLDAQAAELAGRAVQVNDATDAAPARTVDLGLLSAAPLALQRAVLWRTMREVARGRSVDFRHVEDVRRLLESGASHGTVDAPGHRVERIGGTLVLTGRRTRAAGHRSAAPPNLFRYSLSIPGEVFVPAAAATISVVRAAPGAIVSNASECDVALVRSDLCAESLAVRNRRPGDRFRPAGLDGRKKLQDYFVDRKIPRERRDAVPIVVDATDRIVWVAGHQIDDAFRVTDRSQSVLILTFKAVGGAA